MAIEFYEQQLVIVREIGNRRGEGNALGNLGAAYAELGEVRKAIEFFEQRIVIAREIGDLRSEGTALSNIANEYSNLGDYDKSIDYYNQALENAREIGNKYGEGKRLNGLAGVLIEKGDLQNVIIHTKESLRIGQEISSPEVCIESSSTLALTLLFSGKLKDAFEILQYAGKFDQPNYNFNISVLQGIIALRGRDLEFAHEAVRKSIAQADEILAKTPEYYDALDAKGLALCGLALTQDLTGLTESRPDEKGSEGDLSGLITQAIETFRMARKIAPHAGIVKATLRLFDELAKCDQEGLLKRVREVIEGKGDM